MSVIITEKAFTIRLVTIKIIAAVVFMLIETVAMLYIISVCKFENYQIIAILGIYILSVLLGLTMVRNFSENDAKYDEYESGAEYDEYESGIHILSVLLGLTMVRNFSENEAEYAEYDEHQS